MEDNKREEAQRKRDELKLIYSEHIRNLVEYVLIVHRFKGPKSLIETVAELRLDTPGREGITKQEDLSERMVGLAAASGSFLGVVDLLG